MKRTFQLFWQRAWDNLIHLVVVNFIWFAFVLPFVFSVIAIVRELPFEAPTPPSPPMATAAASEEAEAAAATTAAEPADIPADEPPTATADQTGEAPAKRRIMPPIEFTPRLAALLVFSALSWVLVCVATGFVFHVAADLVEGYDFSGYREVLREFLRARPLLYSFGAITACALTFLVAVANLLFYILLAATRNTAYLLLAGIMLWFLLFLTMTFALTLPVLVQRRVGLVRAIRTAAVLSLSQPFRMLMVTGTAGVIAILAVLSGVGVSFFLISAPAVLFNSEVRARFEELDAAGTADDDSPADTNGPADDDAGPPPDQTSHSQGAA